MGCGQLQTVVLVNALYLQVIRGLGGFNISEPRFMSSNAPNTSKKHGNRQAECGGQSHGQGNILFATMIIAGAAGIFNNDLLATTSLRNRSRI